MSNEIPKREAYHVMAKGGTIIHVEFGREESSLPCVVNSLV